MEALVSPRGKRSELQDPRISWRPVVMCFTIVPDLVTCSPASLCGPGVVGAGESRVWGPCLGASWCPGEAATLRASVAAALGGRFLFAVPPALRFRRYRTPSSSGLPPDCRGASHRPHSESTACPRGPRCLPQTLACCGRPLVLSAVRSGHSWLPSLGPKLPTTQDAPGRGPADGQRRGFPDDPAAPGQPTGSSSH